MSDPSPDPTLVVYLDQGCTLSTFQRFGTLERELAVYKRLVAQGIPVVVLSWAKGEDGNLQDEIQPLSLVENLAGGRNRPWMFRQLLTAGRLSEAGIVVMSNQMFGAELAALACWIKGYPFILRFGYLLSENVADEKGKHSLHARLERLRERFVLSLSTAVVVTSDRIKDLLVTRYPRLTCPIHVLPNYVDEEIFKPVNADCESGGHRQSGSLGLVTTGRLAPEKNYVLLIRALALCRDVSLTIIGEGPQRQELQKLAQDLSTSVQFLGMVENRRLPEIYARADVFVLPSRYEGNPKALVEAMACGLPVLGTNVRGIASIVKDGETGVLVEPTVESLCTGIERLRSPEFRRVIAREGRARTLPTVSLAHYTVHLKSVIENTFRASLERAQN